MGAHWAFKGFAVEIRIVLTVFRLDCGRSIGLHSGHEILAALARLKRYVPKRLHPRLRAVALRFARTYRSEFSAFGPYNSHQHGSLRVEPGPVLRR